MNTTTISLALWGLFFPQRNKWLSVEVLSWAVVVLVDASRARDVNAVDNTQFYNSATGQPIPNDAPKVGGRRWKSKKGGRKSRRRQRGGATGVTVGKVYAGFDGSGERGIAHAVQGVHPGNKF